MSFRGLARSVRDHGSSIFRAVTGSGPGPLPPQIQSIKPAPATSPVPLPLASKPWAEGNSSLLQRLLGNADSINGTSDYSQYYFPDAKSTKDIRLMSLDFDYRHHNSQTGALLRADAGVSILDIQDLRAAAHSSLGHLKKTGQLIQSYHFAAQDTRHDRPRVIRFLFGKPEAVSFNYLKRKLEALALRRNVILVLHDPLIDIKVLEQLSIDLCPLYILDTQAEALRMNRFRISVVQTSLEETLKRLGIPYSNLHVAGNDARFTLQALLMLAVQDAKNHLPAHLPHPTWLSTFTKIGRPLIPYTEEELNKSSLVISQMKSEEKDEEVNLERLRRQRKHLEALEASLTNKEPKQSENQSEEPASPKPQEQQEKLIIDIADPEKPGRGEILDELKKLLVISQDFDMTRSRVRTMLWKMRSRIRWELSGEAINTVMTKASRLRKQDVNDQLRDMFHALNASKLGSLGTSKQVSMLVKGFQDIPHKDEAVSHKRAGQKALQKPQLKDATNSIKTVVRQTPKKPSTKSITVSATDDEDPYSYI
ncbi:hypothetical protein B0T17DRAFT_515746 [Bombardia bombarda]|uniref:Gfd2/YDR514C-like C-terminal domain-containing protein n=1 Tax=Bombardia bombarda TaxID=252184 RepID=A0AA39XJV7_9PEZI|nr:hypothetical protein B0T17DRAFT_515746 [Bombardia bombarda]